MNHKNSKLLKILALISGVVIATAIVIELWHEAAAHFLIIFK